MSENPGKVVYQFSAPAKRAVNSIAFSADGKLLAIAQESGREDSPTLSLVRTETGECVQIIERTEECSNGVYRVVFDTARNQLIYVAQANGGFSLNIYNLDLGTRESLDTCRKPMMQHGLSLDKNNHYLLVAGLPIKLWDLETGKLAKSISIQKDEMDEDNELDSLISAVLSANSKHVIVGGIEQGNIALYDVKTENFIKNYTGSFEDIQQVAFNHTGQQVAAVSSYGHGIFLWNTTNGKRILESIFNEDIDLIWAISFSPKENYLALGHVSSYMVLYNSDDGSEIIADKLHDGRVYDVCFSSDGKLLASAGEDAKIFIRSLH
ncbi:MAG: WD40 repeat domain-containing protein [Stenomitos frigidus ULC029]